MSNWQRMLPMAAVVVVLAGAPGCSYNKFTTQEEAIKAQWGQVENQLQRRNDLIPNLVETVKGLRAAGARRLPGGRRRAREDGGRDDAREKIAAPTRSRARSRGCWSSSRAYPQLKSDETFAAADGRAGRHREPAGHRAHALQRAHPGVQHAAPAVPVERDREDVRVQGVSRTSRRRPTPRRCRRWTSSARTGTWR